MSIILMKPEDDLFQSGADILVNPVNCVGVCGKGLAKEFDNRPEFGVPMAFYREVCRKGLLHPGNVATILTAPYVSGLPSLSSLSSPNVVHFATKDHWRDSSRVEWIQHGLGKLRLVVLELARRPEAPARSVAIPALGVGCGGLQWESVRDLVYNAMTDLDVRVYLYPPR